MRGAGAAILAVCAMALSACTSSPESIAANDPFEPMNRAVYGFDERFDQYVILPIGWVYEYHTALPIRRGIHNVLLNLDGPMTFANDLLQGQPMHAGATLGRFAINSTVGLGGIVDLATPIGIPYHRADFGQTLGKYGVPEGPFLVLPVVGPDPPRDLVGDSVDLFADPFLYVPTGAPLYERISVSIGISMASPFELHTRNIVLRRELEKGSVDPYVTMRSIYRQLRDEEIRDGVPGEDDRPPAK